MNGAVETVKELSLEGLIIIGGAVSLAVGNTLSKKGIKVINIPALLTMIFMVQMRR